MVSTNGGSPAVSSCTVHTESPACGRNLAITATSIDFPGPIDAGSGGTVEHSVLTDVRKLPTCTVPHVRLVNTKTDGTSTVGPAAPVIHCVCPRGPSSCARCEVQPAITHEIMVTTAIRTIHTARVPPLQDAPLTGWQPSNRRGRCASTWRLPPDCCGTCTWLRRTQASCQDQANSSHQSRGSRT